MQSLIRISDAAVIGIHSMDYMFKSKQTAFSAKQTAEKLKVSYNHLSKVLQRLNKADYVKTQRGPAGGYFLTEKGRKAKIGEIIAAVEPYKTEYSSCLMPSQVCGRRKCVLKNFLENTKREYKKLLNLRLGEF